MTRLMEGESMDMTLFVCCAVLETDIQMSPCHSHIRTYGFLDGRRGNRARALFDRGRSRICVRIRGPLSAQQQ